MARQRMVTRTIEVLNVTALCVNVTDTTTYFADLELTGMGNVSDTDILKALKKAHETDTIKVVAIYNKSVKEELYGMLELDFLKYAKKLDPMTRKMLADGETIEVDETPEEPEETPEEPEETPTPKKSRNKK